MLTMNPEDTRIRITRHSLSAISDWLRADMRRFAGEQLATFFVKLLGALVVTAVLYVFIFFAIGRGLLGLGEIGPFLPLVPFVIGFIIQAFVHQKTHGVMLVHGSRIRFADHHSDIQQHDEDWLLQFSRWALFPAWLFFSAFESLAASYRLRRANPALCAEVLANMAAVDRRLPVSELELQYSDAGLVQTLRELLAFPGVMVSSREYPCLILSKELGDSIRGML